MKKYIMLMVILLVSCSLANAEVLVNDTFDASAAGNDLTTLGWTNVMGQIVVSSDVIDSGQSAKNNVGGWSIYSKDFSSRILANGETAVLTWSGKVSTPTAADCQAMYIASGDYEFKYYFFVGGYRGAVTKVAGENQGNWWANDYETTNSFAKWKIELTNSTSKFYYDEGAGWVYTGGRDDVGVSTAGVINLVNAGGSWTDNINYTILPLENVPEPGSLLALGSGLLGLAGFVIRRRK